MEFGRVAGTNRGLTDLYLLDQKGELAGRFNYSDGQQVIVDGIRRLIH